MAFAISQVGGIPVGLYLANHFGWEAPFFLIAGFSILTAFVIIKFLKPVVTHMERKSEVNPVLHLRRTVSNRQYLLPFLTTALLSIGGFMMMPFSTPFIINNLHISQLSLPLIYVITGMGSMIILPVIGKLSDRIGKYPTFVGGTILAIIMVFIYTNLSPIPVWELIIINVIMFAGIMSRMIPSTALMTAIPALEDRGAFMSINSSLQQVAGGIASVIAGIIIYQEPGGKLQHFNTLGYVTISVMILCTFLLYIINNRVSSKINTSQNLPPSELATV